MYEIAVTLLGGHALAQARPWLSFRGTTQACSFRLEHQVAGPLHLDVTMAPGEQSVKTKPTDDLYATAGFLP